MITKNILNSSEYSFLKTDEHLGENIILLGLAGSYSYGTNNAESDIDVRGITLNRKSDLIGLTEYEQYVDTNTDTTIYAFNKIIKLLLSCNPNTIELLGLRREHYLYLNNIGEKLLPEVEKLISLKITMAESDKAIKISSINDYLEKNIAYYKNLLENMEDDRTPDWSTLNNLFINSIKWYYFYFVKGDFYGRK